MAGAARGGRPHLDGMPEPKRDTRTHEVLPRDFGPYRMVRRLGMGGMAETYEAIRRGPSGFAQRVCLKLVLPYFRDDEDFVRLFEREAKLAAKLRHRNIVGVIDFGSLDGTYYMALELVDGVDLQGLLDAQSGKRLSHDYVALLGHELASALQHAHNPPRESGFDGTGVSAIIHRDISPSNVLISRLGEVFIADFGVAKAVSGASHKQSTVKGKIPYMSPEQLRARDCDGRADLFSLGVVLFEALGGERPYDGGNDPATIIKILNGDHPSLIGLAPAAPPGMCEIIERLIRPAIDERPKTAAELIDLLDEFVPSPRALRELGKMVAKIRPESEAPPEVNPDAATDPGGPSANERNQRTSGIVGAGEGEKTLSDQNAQDQGDHDGSVPPSNARETADERRSRVVLIAGLLLAASGLAAGGFALWDANRGQDVTPDRASETTEPVAQPAAPVAKDVVADPVLDAPSPTATPVREAPEPREQRTTDINAEAKPATEPAPSSPVRASPTPAVVRSAKLTVAVFPWGYVWINGKPRGRAPLKDEALKPGRYKISAGKETPTTTRTIRLRAGQREVVQFDLSE